MLTLAILSVAGLAVLALAADRLVVGSGRPAERLGIPPVIVVVIVIALLYGLGPPTGIALSAALLGAAILLVRFARTAPRDALPSETDDYLEATVRPRLALETVRTFLGLGGTLLGAQLLVANASERKRTDVQMGLSRPGRSSLHSSRAVLVGDAGSRTRP
ncbi:hypothetical protein [Nonomuraea aurantiaca]|uniref:hypothetical protein n=1 Tax=Nonomuraea aurantiaca TaxID=2878562 RepID=UPI001CD9A98E|nr:hypothetical protein [Nonomuraea aurantiaca]MCA2228847.1 hypothetical protein [Nonomuraea aurantiaca]